MHTCCRLGRGLRRLQVSVRCRQRLAGCSSVAMLLERVLRRKQPAAGWRKAAAAHREAAACGSGGVRLRWRPCSSRRHWHAHHDARLRLLAVLLPATLLLLRRRWLWRLSCLVHLQLLLRLLRRLPLPQLLSLQVLQLRRRGCVLLLQQLLLQQLLRVLLQVWGQVLLRLRLRLLLRLVVLRLRLRKVLALLLRLKLLLRLHLLLVVLLQLLCRRGRLAILL